MSQTFEPGDPERFRPASGPGPGPGFVRGWDWSRQDPRPGLPWLGLVLVLFGGLLLLGEFVPGFHVAGPALGVAAGVAFLVAWITNHGRWGLYPGIFVLAVSLPAFLIDLGVIQDAPGWTTLFLGIGLLIVAIARWTSRGGIGWQAILGALLSLSGGGDVVHALVPGAPSVDALVLPVVLVSLGLLILMRSTQPRRR